VELQPQSVVDPPCGATVVHCAESRNSSGGLYRSHRRSAHDRRRTNAMLFLMNTLLASLQIKIVAAYFFWKRPALKPATMANQAVRSRARERRNGIKWGIGCLCRKRVLLTAGTPWLPPKALLAEVTFKRLPGLRGTRYGNLRFTSRKVGSRRLGLSRGNTDSGPAEWGFLLELQ
jgi:hypothetical protein